MFSAAVAPASGNSAPASAPQIVLHETSPTHATFDAAYSGIDKGKAPERTTLNSAAVVASSRPRKGSTGIGISARAVVESGWGANFWVTLVDPETQTAFYACPSTGQVSWDPPVGNFVLPPSEEGEWWELVDETHNLPYYYHTKSGETTWEKPDAFVIPLRAIQNSALGRRISTSFRQSLILEMSPTPSSQVSLQNAGTGPPTSFKTSNAQKRRSRSYTSTTPTTIPAINTSVQPAQPSRNSPSKAGRKSMRRSLSQDMYHALNGGGKLSPIPSVSGSGSDDADLERASAKLRKEGKEEEEGLGRSRTAPSTMSTSSKRKSGIPPLGLGLDAAIEMITSGNTKTNTISFPPSAGGDRLGTPKTAGFPITGSRNVAGVGAFGRESEIPTLDQLPPRSPLLNGLNGRGANASAPPSPKVGNAARLGKGISGPIFNYVSPPDTDLTHLLNAARDSYGSGGGGEKDNEDEENANVTLWYLEATANMSPVKNRGAHDGRPVLVDHRSVWDPNEGPVSATGSTQHPILPPELANDIQKFTQSDFARQYFATHKTGFIWRRRVPVEKMMSWQKPALTAPLLVLNKSLHKDAVKAFKIIQRIMGDRDRDRSMRSHLHTNESHGSGPGSSNGHGPNGGSENKDIALLEEERWLTGQGLAHGELRDEIYCQVMKQLSGNQNPESIFRGWQLLCVLLITFPPSKNFEPYLHGFIQRQTTQPEGRVDVMAKYCLRRLAFIAKKGPRGKAPTITEIEVASDAAFNPSIFGESLDAIYRLQERNYPDEKVPIILPFLSDGILALGGTKCEGIFRVPGDGDSVADLKLRLDRGYYTLDGVDDPHVLASLLKLWLRELLDPLVPEEMYNDCITKSKEPQMCVDMVHRLPTINRRVVLFVISFLQLFLDEKIQNATKMTSANLALVMAPNVLRCNSDSMAVVFTNAQYEQFFVHNLLLHLRCDQVDPEYVPTHGLRPDSSPKTRPQRC